MANLFIPKNEKSLLHFLFQVMADVRNDAIEPSKVDSICRLSKEAQKLLAGERDRARLCMEIDRHEKEFGRRVPFRDMAAIGFSDTTIDPTTGKPRVEDTAYLDLSSNC